MMKKYCFSWFWIITVAFSSGVHAQESGASVKPKWNHSFENDFYFYKNDFLYLPIYAVNMERLHLEARYNYEDTKTVSAWGGYNFTGGNNFEYTITPMAGIVAGNTTGVAPGLEICLGYKGFEIYSESEYVFDLKEKENNYYYNWTDLSYSPKEWIWFGLSGQLTRSHQTDAEFGPGLLLGGGYRWLELTGYAYNIGGDDPFIMLSLSVYIPE